MKQKETNRYKGSRHSVPRTSYQRDYFFKGQVPLFATEAEQLKSNNPLDIIKGIDRGPRTSVYHQEFKSKKVTLVDSNSLDCRQNKFKYFLRHVES